MTFEYEQKPWLMNQKTILAHNRIIISATKSIFLIIKLPKYPSLPIYLAAI